MHKIILFILTLISFNATYASEVHVYNMNNQYPIEVTYKICFSSKDGKIQNCLNENKITINAKTSATTQNYAVISEPKQLLTSDYRVNLFLISAIEKDISGNVISIGKFSVMNNNQIISQCSAGLNNNDSIKKWLILNDMKDSPNILCFESYSY